MIKIAAAASAAVKLATACAQERFLVKLATDKKKPEYMVLSCDMYSGSIAVQQ